MIIRSVYARSLYLSSHGVLLLLTAADNASRTKRAASPTTQPDTVFNERDAFDELFEEAGLQALGAESRDLLRFSLSARAGTSPNRHSLRALRCASRAHSDSIS